MEKLTVSIVKGSGCLAHNDRTLVHKKWRDEQSWDPALSERNEIFKNEELAYVYEKLFRPSVDKYNEKIRKDRRIKNYLDKIERSKQEKPFYELIVTIGNAEDVPSGSDLEKICQEILAEYVDDFQNRNSNFYLFQAIMHNDEKGISHVHLDFVPYSTGNKRGLEVKNSFSGAMKEMGFKGPDGFAKWREREQQVLIGLMKQREIEFKPGNGRQTHLSIPEYKDLQSRIADLEMKEEAQERKEHSMDFRDVLLSSAERNISKQKIENAQEKEKLAQKRLALEMKEISLKSEMDVLASQAQLKNDELLRLDGQIRDKKLLVAGHDHSQHLKKYVTPTDIRNFERKDFEMYRQRNKLTKKETSNFELPESVLLQDREEAVELAEKYARLALKQKNRADGFEKAISEGRHRLTKQEMLYALDLDRIERDLKVRADRMDRLERERIKKEEKNDEREKNLLYRESLILEKEKYFDRLVEMHENLPAVQERLDSLENENKKLKKRISSLQETLTRVRKSFNELRNELLKLGESLYFGLSKSVFERLMEGFRQKQPALYRGMSIYNECISLKKKQEIVKRTTTKDWIEDVLDKGRKLLSKCLNGDPAVDPREVYRSEFEDYDDDMRYMTNYDEPTYTPHSVPEFEIEESDKDDDFGFGFW